MAPSCTATQQRHAPSSVRRCAIQEVARATNVRLVFNRIAERGSEGVAHASEGFGVSGGGETNEGGVRHRLSLTEAL